MSEGAAAISPYIARRSLGFFSRLPPPRPAEREYGLTAREREILQLPSPRLEPHGVGSRPRRDRAGGATG
jgi:hypothetical protein